MIARKADTLRKRLSGQGLVEAAIVIPLLVTLLMLAVDGAAAFRAQMVAEAAASEGARYAAQHPDATTSEVSDWAKASVGIDGDFTLTLTKSDLEDQRYTMTVIDMDGAERTAEAVNKRVASKVSVSIPFRFFATGGSYTAVASHTGVTSTEGVM